MDLLGADPAYRGPVCKLPNQTLVACGDHYMWVDNNDAGVGLGLLKKGEWQRDDFAVAMGLVAAGNSRGGGAFLDIGANIGTHSIYAALSKQFSRVISVEPERENIRLLKQNIGLNALSIPVHVVEKAVGGTKGTAFLSISRNDSGMHVVNPERSVGDVEIELSTVPDILADLSLTPSDVSFVWMDIEGREFDVFPTLFGLMRNRTPIFFEHSRGVLNEEGFRYWTNKFADFGYRAFVVERGESKGPMAPVQALELKFGNILLL